MATLGASDDNPIDLTGSDNEDEYLRPDAKRARINGSAAAFIPHLPDFGSHMLAPPFSNNMMNSSLPSLSQPMAQRGPWSSLQTPQPFHARTWGSQPTKGQIQHQFNVLSRAQPSPFATIRPPHVTQIPPQAQQSNQQPNFIDLTAENASARLSPAPQQTTLVNQMLVLDENLNPKTPILIGQINVSALVMSPVPYIIQRPTHTILTNGQVLTSNIIDYVPVKVRVKPDINPLANDISIFTLPQQIRGNVITPVEFAVVEKKVAAKLYQLLVERVIRLEGMIRTVPDGSNVLVVPLSVLVFTVKGNVSAIADKLRQHGLTLERPGVMWDTAFKMDAVIYHNPHEGLPSLNKMSPSPSVSSRWSTPVSSKNVEVQRNAAEAAFQTLRGEEDLMETYPGQGENISTPLYPHQRKALSFLLEREQELVGPAGKAASLWHCNGSGWQNAVTNELIYTKPEECKGALLADDMGLGKTLETLCLLAATIDKADGFASKPVELPPPPEPVESEPELTFDHFAGRVFDMPTLTKKATQAKDKKKVAYEKAMLEYNRLSKVKERSQATLIICPLSTIVSWEEQIKDHWGGEVQVVGGVGSTQVVPSTIPANPSIQTSDGSLHLESLNLEPPKSDQQSRQPTPTISHNINKKGRPIRVYVYHGASRRLDAQFIAKFDIVITTYSTLSSEYSKQSKTGLSDTTEDDEGVSSDSGVVEVDDAGNPLIKRKAKSTKRKRPFIPGDTCSPLQAIHWFRVVLDEAHCIKEPTTVASRACCDLIADRRLCLTGTPLQNKVDDVYALIKFLRLKPFDDKSTWTQWIGTPVKFNQPIGATRLQTIMRLLALRRTKDTKDPDGKPILALPPRSDQMILLKLQADERSVYDDFFGESQAEFKSMAKADVMKNYVNILQKILRLRQICDDVELMKASKDGMRYDCAAQFEEALVAIDKDGINLERASAIFALLRETATAQCAECGMELVSNPVEGGIEPATDAEEIVTSNGKRGRKMKNLGTCTPSAGTGTRTSSPCPTVHPIITRCTHLFCMCCFRSKICPEWPRAAQEFRAPCPVCQLEICPAVDAIEVQSDGVDLKKKEVVATGTVKRVRRARGEPIVNYKPSTKIRALIQELMPLSKKNPHSANYEITMDDIQEVDEAGREKEPDIVKSVVFSQWTSMLDKIEDALEVNKIHYERLDGGMKREERNRSMDALKNDPRCEVLLVSLKAGGVGLTLTAASRVYLMDPYWNPAVENQAVDRVHRLGQVKPVIATKFIIENSIEQRLLEVQKKKADLATLTLGRPLSKQDLQQRRLEELQNLLGGGEGDNNMDDA